MADVIAGASGPTVIVAGVLPVGALRFSVTPLITLLTLLLLLVMGTLSTVSSASSPATACVKAMAPQLGRNRLPLTDRLPGTPDTALTTTSRAPLASLITLARTALLRLLMAAAACASVLFEESIVKETTGTPPAEMEMASPVRSAVLAVATAAV